jgi:predicted dehydrogenase/threonine dehydrogenase-like Zn-dependent dehydrogenase
MKQVTQRARDGRIAVIDVPRPSSRPGWVLVANRYSLISAGTERAKVEIGEKNLLQKARARPDLVRKAVERARVEGVRSAVTVARERFATLTPLGYSSAGSVVEVGAGVEGLVPGDRVACAGGGWANHAELVAVPRTLVAKVPQEVELTRATYATVGAIALHAVRQSEARLGERVGVIGLGLVGQLAVRILVAAGCEPFGIDLDESAVDLARRAGAAAFRRDDPALEASVAAATGALGLDSVLLCAATSSSDPLQLAVQLARDRGRLVVVGEIPVQADRGLLYEKELELRLSRSYGPGRYDRDYEEHGRDLPAAYVRWTEQRNLQAFIDLIAAGRLDPSELTTHVFPVERADEAYATLTGEADDGRPFGILLEYQYEERPPLRARPTRLRSVSGLGVGLIGAGSFARATLVPSLSGAGAHLVAVCTEGGLSAADVAARFGFDRAAASPQEILGDEAVGAVIIATRHSSHALLAAAALRAGKAVFVEKPLALAEAELAEVEVALNGGGLLMVGFNRRFAPLTERLRAEIGGTPPLALAARVNAGPLPSDHWLHDPEVGGGRLLGEGCHFVDLLAHLAGSPPVSVHAFAAPEQERPLECSDDFVASLRFADGTVASLTYTGHGDARLAKERIEAFWSGSAAVLDDFRRLELYCAGKRTIVKQRQDKGHRAEIEAFVRAASGLEEPPSPESYVASTRATLALADSLRRGLPVALS